MNFVVFTPSKSVSLDAYSFFLIGLFFSFFRFLSHFVFVFVGLYVLCEVYNATSRVTATKLEDVHVTLGLCAPS